MSKSYGNFIDIFAPEKALKKTVMGIVTDSTPLEEPKNPDSCNVFNIYKLLASGVQVDEMRTNYTGGNYGYGHAKKALLDLILSVFAEERKHFDQLMTHPEEIDAALAAGAEKARHTAREVLHRVRQVLGY